MAHEKPQNNDGWFDPHPGEDFYSDTDQPDDQSCALISDKTAPREKDHHHDKQVKNNPE